MQSDKIKLRRKLNKIPSVRCVFLSHDKNACSIFAYLLMEVKVCVAAIGACVFGARLRLRTFLLRKEGIFINEKYIYNPKTKRLHVEGCCPDAKPNKEYILFNTEDEAVKYGGRALGFCQHCMKKREKILRGEK